MVEGEWHNRAAEASLRSPPQQKQATDKQLQQQEMTRSPKAAEAEMTDKPQWRVKGKEKMEPREITVHFRQRSMCCRHLRSSVCPQGSGPVLLKHTRMQSLSQGQCAWQHIKNLAAANESVINRN